MDSRDGGKRRRYPAPIIIVIITISCAMYMYARMC